MNALDLAKRIGAQILSNKVRHPQTGVVLAQFEGAELVLTDAGQELAASLPATAKTPRAAKPAAVESADEAPAQAPSAPEAAE